jgi:hypothetical protein
MLDHTARLEYRRAFAPWPYPLLCLAWRLGWGGGASSLRVGGPEIDPWRDPPMPARTRRGRGDDGPERPGARQRPPADPARGRKLASENDAAGPGDVTALSADVARTPPGHGALTATVGLICVAPGPVAISSSPILAGRPRAVARLPHAVLRPGRAPTMGSGDVDPGPPARGRLGHHGDDVPRP